MLLLKSHINQVIQQEVGVGIVAKIFLKKVKYQQRYDKKVRVPSLKWKPLDLKCGLQT